MDSIFREEGYISHGIFWSEIGLRNHYQMKRHFQEVAMNGQYLRTVFRAVQVIVENMMRQSE